MTSVRYTLQDAMGWARFSGDWNPVHFSLTRAKAQGASRLSVHGMRALLDVKGALAPDLSSPWVKCTVRLRQPLWCDTEYSLSVQPVGAQALVVTQAQQQEVRLSCRLTGQNAAPQGGSHEIKRPAQEEMRALYREFMTLMPGARQWHFLDAIMFRQLICEPALMAQPAIAAVLPAPLTLNELFDRFHVVQTHQEVIFDAHLQAPLTRDMGIDLVSLRLLPSLVVEAPGGGLVVQVGVSAAISHPQRQITNRLTLKIETR